MVDPAAAEVERRTALAWPHKTDLAAAARRLLKCPGDAEDAAIEAITRYLASARAGRVPDAKVRRYLFGMLRNVCREMNRGVLPTDVTARLAMRESVSTPDHAESIADRASDAATLARTQLLPEPQRAALHYNAAGLTLAQAARRAGVGERTAESRLTAARRTLRRVAAPVAFLLSLWRARPRRAAVVALAVAAVALVPAVVRVVPDPSRPGFVTDAAPAPVVRREAQGGHPATRAVEQRSRAATPTATPTPTPPPTRDRALAATGGDVPQAPKHPSVTRERVFASPTADRPLLDVVGECIDKGVEVTPERVGCRT